MQRKQQTLLFYGICVKCQLPLYSVKSEALLLLILRMTQLQQPMDRARSIFLRFRSSKTPDASVTFLFMCKHQLSSNKLMSKNPHTPFLDTILVNVCSLYLAVAVSQRNYFPLLLHHCFFLTLCKNMLKRFRNCVQLIPRRIQSVIHPLTHKFILPKDK